MCPCMHACVCVQGALFKIQSNYYITVWITGLIMWTTSRPLWRCLILAKKIQLQWQTQRLQLTVMGALIRGGRLQTAHLRCAGTSCPLYCLRMRPCLNGCGGRILPIWSSTEDYMKEGRNRKNFSVCQCFASKVKYVCAYTQNSRAIMFLNFGRCSFVLWVYASWYDHSVVTAVICEKL